MRPVIPEEVTSLQTVDAELLADYIMQQITSGSENSTVELNEILKQYLVCSFEKVALALEEPVSYRLSRFNQRKNALQEQYTAKATELGLTLEVDNTFGEPVIFTRTDDKVKEVEERLKRNVVQAAFPALNIEAMDSMALRNKHMDYAREMTILKKVNRKLAFLVEHAKLSGEQADTTLAFERVGPEQFRICAHDDLAMGYSLHLVQLYAKDLPPASNPYAGNLEFNVTSAELKQWDQYLTDVEKWHADFHLLMKGLIGDDVGDYVKTAQKSLAQIVEGEDRRPSNFMTREVLNQLRRLPQSRTVLLMTQVALDFTTHIYRDQMRTCFEGMYAAADDPIHKTPGLRDNKGDLKTFVIENRQKTYLSGLAIIQIEAIFDMLMAHSLVASKAREMGFDSQFNPTFIDCLGAESVPLYQYFTQQLLELPVGTMNQLHATVVSKFPEQIIQQGPAHVLNAFDKTVGSILKTHAGVAVKYKSSHQGEATDITDQQKRALLPQGARHTYPSIAHEVAVLFEKLKRCQAYVKVKLALETEGLCQDLDRVITQLQQRLTQGLQTYNRDYFYGSDAARGACEYVMNWIARMVYQAHSQVTDESIKQSMTKLLGIVGETSQDRLGAGDLAGCNRGLWGRCAELASTLTTASGDAVQQAFEALLQRTADEVFSQLPGMRSSESSMYVLKKPQVLIRLGLHPYRNLAQNESPISPEDMQRFLKGMSEALSAKVVYEEIKDTVISNLRSLIKDERDEEIYRLLKQIGFLEHSQGEVTEAEQQDLDQRFRMTPGDATSPWNFNQLYMDLPKVLVGLLQVRGFIQTTQPGQLEVTHPSTTWPNRERTEYFAPARIQQPYQTIQPRNRTPQRPAPQASRVVPQVQVYPNRSAFQAPQPQATQSRTNPGYGFIGRVFGAANTDRNRPTPAVPPRNQTPQRPAAVQATQNSIGRGFGFGGLFGEANTDRTRQGASAAPAVDRVTETNYSNRSNTSGP